MDQTLNLSSTSESSLEESTTNMLNFVKRRNSLEQILSDLDKADECVFSTPQQPKSTRMEKLRIYAKLQANKPKASVQSPLNINMMKETVVSPNKQPSPVVENETSIVVEEAVHTPSPFHEAKSKFAPVATPRKFFPATMETTSTQPKPNSRQPSFIPSLATIMKNEQDTPKKLHTRRFSNQDLGFLPISTKLAQSKVLPEVSSARLVKIASEADRTPYTFNMLQPINSAHSKPNSLLSTPDYHKATGSPYGSTKTPSSRLVPITSDYLVKVLTNRNGENSASTIDSQRSLESLASPVKHDRFAKRGSFSVFRKLVESEIQH